MKRFTQGFIAIAAFFLVATAVRAADERPTQYQQYLNRQASVVTDALAADTARSDAKRAMADAISSAMNGLESRDKAMVALALILTNAQGSSGANNPPQIQNVALQAPPEECNWFCWVMKGGGALLGTVERLAGPAVQIASSRYSHLSQIAQIKGNTDIAAINGETTRYQWGVVNSMNGQTVQGMTQLGNGIATTLGTPSYTWNVGGDYAGRDLVGRYSGQGSGSSGTQNFGSGLLNLGNSNRFTSPGPFATECTTAPANTDGTTNASTTGGSITCPIN